METNTCGSTPHAEAAPPRTRRLVPGSQRWSRLCRLRRDVPPRGDAMGSSSWQTETTRRQQPRSAWLSSRDDSGRNLEVRVGLRQLPCCANVQSSRGVAQPGRALRLGRRGRGFGSRHPDFVRFVPLAVTALTFLGVIVAGVGSPSDTVPQGTSALRGRIERVDAAQAKRMAGVSWRKGCPVPLRDLRLLTMTHWGFDRRVRTGRLIVHRDQLSLRRRHDTLVGARVRPSDRRQSDREPVRLRWALVTPRERRVRRPLASATRHGPRGRRSRPRVRTDWLGLGRPLDVGQGLPALLGQRSLTSTCRPALASAGDTPRQLLREWRRRTARRCRSRRRPTPGCRARGPGSEPG